MSSRRRQKRPKRTRRCDEELEAQALAAEAAEEAAVVPAPEDEAPRAGSGAGKTDKEGFARLKRSLLKTKQNLGSGYQPVPR